MQPVGSNTIQISGISSKDKKKILNFLETGNRFLELNKFKQAELFLLEGLTLVRSEKVTEENIDLELQFLKNLIITYNKLNTPDEAISRMIQSITAHEQKDTQKLLKYHFYLLKADFLFLQSSLKSDAAIIADLLRLAASDYEVVRKCIVQFHDFDDYKQTLTPIYIETLFKTAKCYMLLLNFKAMRQNLNEGFNAFDGMQDSESKASIEKNIVDIFKVKKLIHVRNYCDPLPEKILEILFSPSLLVNTLLDLGTRDIKTIKFDDEFYKMLVQLSDGPVLQMKVYLQWMKNPEYELSDEGSDFVNDQLRDPNLDPSIVSLYVKDTKKPLDDRIAFIEEKITGCSKDLIQLWGIFCEVYGENDTSVTATTYILNSLQIQGQQFEFALRFIEEFQNAIKYGTHGLINDLFSMYRSFIEFHMQRIQGPDDIAKFLNGLRSKLEDLVTFPLEVTAKLAEALKLLVRINKIPSECKLIIDYTRVELLESDYLYRKSKQLLYPKDLIDAFKDVLIEADKCKNLIIKVKMSLKLATYYHNNLVFNEAVAYYIIVIRETIKSSYKLSEDILKVFIKAYWGYLKANQMQNLSDALVLKVKPSLPGLEEFSGRIFARVGKILYQQRLNEEFTEHSDSELSHLTWALESSDLQNRKEIESYLQKSGTSATDKTASENQFLGPQSTEFEKEIAAAMARAQAYGSTSPHDTSLSYPNASSRRMGPSNRRGSIIDPSFFQPPTNHAFPTLSFFNHQILQAKIEGVTPLVNSGTTCFLNSVFQMIMHHKELAEAINEGIKLHLKEELDPKMKQALEYFPIAFEKYNKGESDINLEKLRLLMPENDNRGHQDATGFRAALFKYLSPAQLAKFCFKLGVDRKYELFDTSNDKEQEGRLESFKSKKNDVSQLKDTNFINNPSEFDFQFIINVNSEFVDLQSKLGDLFEYNKPSEIPSPTILKDGKGEYQCFILSQEKSRLDTTPDWFSIRLNLFDYKNKDTVKKMATIIPSLELTLNGKKYELVRFATHSGNNAFVGHYVAYVKSDKGWVSCNDKDITQISDVGIYDVLQGFYFGDYRLKESALQKPDSDEKKKE